MKRSSFQTHIAAGFSLLEVLVAIVVLGLGLLGLGAVFPVVIAQQRESVAIVEGISVASMAENILTSSDEIIDFSPWFNPDPITGLPNRFGYDGPAPAGEISYDWIVAPFSPYNTYEKVPGFAGFTGSTDGRWYIELDAGLNPVSGNDITTAEGLNTVLTLHDRLVPQPYSGKDPKYVWDIVARRQPGSLRPQLAIFIRQIDQRIRVPSNQSLSDMLIAGSPDTNRPVLPVALYSGTHPQVGKRGLPAVDDGIDTNIVYAQPQSLQVQVAKDHLDWLIIEDANNTNIDTSISFVTEPGQQLLDNTGVVRTVLGPATGPDSQQANARIIRVSPPFSASNAVDEIMNYNMTNNDNPMTEADRASWIRQVVFTPRKPLAIHIVTLEEDSP
ncbi:MAG: prepilin-type N-terminal cleavage/methylation domain-containing protein [Phycisphaerales bacterium]|nr:prepilin-type N-terminal cleavage/methylation domain-containing protein [Phycisphaerales bacterium]